MRVAPFWAVVLALACAAAPPPARAEDTFALDLYALSQHDAGGQPLRAEGMTYGGLRVALDAGLSDTLALAVNAVGGLIDNDAPRALPPTLDQVLTTQASAMVITLDAQAALRWTPRDSPASLVGGLSYHHQRRYVSLGADLTGQLELAGGDTLLALTYALRVAILKPRRWDDLILPFDYLTSHNLILAFTQNLSAAWLLNVSLQYTRQDGLMGDAYNFVVLYDPTATPVRLTFEVLPRERDRLQLSGRVRLSPRRGWALGLDASTYADSWDIRHGAVEPNIEVPFGAATRLRLWYRFAAQSRARYFRARPTADARYQTQDFDLDAWTAHSAGALFAFPLADDAALRLVGRLSLFGFVRSDGISALAADLGATASW